VPNHVMSRSVEAPRRDSFKLETEEWVGLHDRATTGDDLSTTMRDKVQSCKFLEDTNRVGGAQNGDGARKANVFRERGGRTENHGWGRMKELGPMMAENKMRCRSC
jgi:hypothetical protein